MGSEQLAEAAALTARSDDLRAGRGWPDARLAYEQATAADPACARASGGLASRRVTLATSTRPAMPSSRRIALACGPRRPECRPGCRWRSRCPRESVSRRARRRQRLVRAAGALLKNCPDTPERAWLLLWRAHVHIHIRDDLPEGRDLLAGALRLNARCRSPSSTRWRAA